jgi:hypothetical protein
MMTRIMATESTEEHGRNMNNLNYFTAISWLDNNSGAAPAVPVFVINQMEAC